MAQKTARRKKIVPTQDLVEVKEVINLEEQQKPKQNFRSKRRIKKLIEVDEPVTKKKQAAKDSS